MTQSLKEALSGFDPGEPPTGPAPVVPVHYRDVVADKNKQLFQPSDAEADALALHNARAPNLRIIHETVEHRFLAYLFAQNMGVKQVFLHCGGEWNDTLGEPVSGTGQWSYPWLSQIRRQPWMVRQIVRILEEAGKDRVQAALEAELIPSLELMREVRDGLHGAKVSERVVAAQFFFDRALGKATQHIKAETVHTVASYEDDVAKLQLELDSLNAQLKNVGVVDVESSPSTSPSSDF